MSLKNKYINRQRTYLNIINLLISRSGIFKLYKYKKASNDCDEVRIKTFMSKIIFLKFKIGCSLGLVT